MNYLLEVLHDENRPEPEPERLQQSYKDVDYLNEEMKAAGVMVFAGGLQPTTTLAKTLRVRDGEVVVTDGPNEKLNEPLSGFWIIKAPSREAALEWARKGAIACGETIELRELHEDVDTA